MKVIEFSWTHNYEEVVDKEIDLNVYKCIYNNLSRKNKKSFKRFSAFSLALVNPNIIGTYLRIGTIKDVCPEFDGSIESLIPPDLKNADLKPFLNDKVDLDLISTMLGEEKGRLILFAAICVGILLFSGVYNLFVNTDKPNSKDYEYEEVTWKTVLKQALIIIISIFFLLIPVMMF